MEAIFVVKTLNELVKNRKELIEAHRKNDFTDGIHALLTDLYPDSAHFIYELLQNAEDMNATAVRFFLTKNGIDFEHNGTKRMFTLGDIDAITNIGHNGQKKDDPTSIGKFGVGFKAVFAYTSTPEIHSGQYHFRIVDYFVPEFDGVSQVKTCDEFGIQWTKFYLPFNNVKKPSSIAYNETLKGLDALDENSILFLQHIQKIEYMLPDGSIGTLERAEQNHHIVQISCKKPYSTDESTTQWLKFYRPIEIIDDQGYRKTLSIAVAYAMVQDKKTESWKLVPVCGKTFIYFPAEKEHSGLRFHINAPFASTVARDSVRNCGDNYKLIKQISQLVAESISEIKRMHLLNHSFFEVLPNEKDNLSGFYQTVFDFVYRAFQDNEYLPTKARSYVAAPNALVGPVALANLFDEKLLEKLLDIHGNWILNAPQRNSRADQFIESLDIREITYKSFQKLFSDENRAKTESFLKAQSNEWMKRFYLLCSTAYNNLGTYDKIQPVEEMRRTRMIRSTKKEMLKPGQIYILPNNTELITKSTNIVDQYFLLESSKNDDASAEIYSFFTKILKIELYGPKVEIERALKKYRSNGITADDDYFGTILAFAKYTDQNRDRDINFSKEKIFLFCENDKLYHEIAENLFLGMEYENLDGEILAKAVGKKCLWTGYKTHYNEEEFKQFYSFVIRCGIKKSLSIEKVSAYQNPKFSEKLSSPARNTGYGTNSDYTIQNLTELLKLNNTEINKIIWKTLKKYQGSQYVYALYSPNGTAEVKRSDSTLIYWLKEYAWIADKNGTLCQPKDLTESDLGDGFEFDADSDLLKALKIGSAKAETNLKRIRLEKEVKAAGYRMVSEEDYEKFERWYKEMKASQDFLDSAPKLSVSEMFNRQNKSRVIGDSIVQNERTSLSSAEQKTLNIEASFKNAKKMSMLRRKLFGKIVDSTKEEKKRLKFWYNGKCQMCGTMIVGYNQVPHFVAKNIINTQIIPANLRHTMELGWNSLCLCPNCAMKYDVCSRDISSLYEQILEKPIGEGKTSKVILTIELNGKNQSICYEPEHFWALKKVIQLLDNETKDK